MKATWNIALSGLYDISTVVKEELWGNVMLKHYSIKTDGGMEL
jgi:hypothetical protein